MNDVNNDLTTSVQGKSSHNGAGYDMREVCPATSPSMSIS